MAGEDPLVGALTAIIVTEAVYCYILPVLVIFGSVGNVLTLIVLGVDKKKDTTNMSLTALAISDTGYIVTTFIRQSSCIVGKLDSVTGRNFNTLMFGQMIVVNICFARVTGLITTVISTERCLAVMVPLKVRDLVTRRRMLIVLVCVFLGTFVLIGPVFFMGESKWVKNPISNATYVRYSLTKWYLQNKAFADNYRDIFLNVLFRFLPTALILFNTVAIIVRLKRASAWRGEKSTTTANQTHLVKEKKLTIMLVLLCAIFIICTIPGLIFQIFTYTTSQFTVFGKYKHTYKLTTAISLLTQYINSSINFIIYVGLNDRFAKTFLRLVGRRPRDKGDSLNTKTSN